MTAYIKRRSDFSTALYASPSSWDVPIASASDDTGTIIFAEPIDRAYVGDWIYADGNLWMIVQIEPQEQTTQITVASWLNAFSRQLIYPGAGGSVGGFIAAELTAQFLQVSDTVYRLSYLSISNTDNTPFVAPSVQEGLYSLADYIRTRSEVKVDFALTGSGLAIAITTAAPITRTVLFDDGHSQLLTQTFSRDMTAKVTVYQGDHATDFYLSSTGGVSTDPPASRAEGAWKVIAADTTRSAEDAAIEVFAANVNSHKIEFVSDVRYELGDKICTRLNGATAQTAITYIGSTSADSRYRYKCGDLRTNLTEQLRTIKRDATESAKTAIAVVNLRNTVSAHESSTSNPHQVTAAQAEAAPAGYGLGEVAKDISNTNLLVTLATGKSGLYMGENVTNAPTNGRYVFAVKCFGSAAAVVDADGMSFGSCGYKGLYINGVWQGWQQ